MRKLCLSACMCLLCLFLVPKSSIAQVTITGTGTGAFQCNEGAAPTSLFVSGTDTLWCDTSHWFQMNNNNGTSTSIEGIAGSDVDNTILVSAVDANGNPSYLTFSGGAITLNGATTSFIAYIGGLREVVSTNLTSVITLGNSSVDFITIKQNATPTGSDVGFTTLAPVYGRTQPTCSSTTAPQYWFDTTVGKMKSCVNSDGFNITNPPALILGAVAVDASGNTLAAHEPWHLNPATRVREFGNGASGFNKVTGANNQDGWQQYSALEVTTSGVLTHTQISAPSDPGLFAYSQNPVLVAFTGKIDLGGLGRPGGAGGTGTGAVGNNCGWGGAGGGGGSGNTGGGGSLGGVGGQRSVFFAAFASGGGNATSNSTGGAGATPTNIPPLNGQMLLISGCGGGAGAGDGTHAGGAGGTGGGGLYLKAPSVVIGSAALVDADGTAGSIGTAGGSASGGGGGGGGVIILDTWFEESAITITAASGAGGGAGGGHAGGAGGTGIVQVIQRQ